jgi:hypothetical protein
MPYVEGAVKGNRLYFLPPEFQIERCDRTFGREFLLEEDGIAHVGMLPDFINHIQSLGDPRSNILLSSAAATYYAWWRANNRRGIVAASGLPPLTEPVSVCLSP